MFYSRLFVDLLEFVSRGDAEARDNTGTEIYYVYFSASTDRSWGEDRLDRTQTLRNGASVSFNLPQPLASSYDIMLEDPRENTYSKMNVRLTANSRIEFTRSDRD